MAYKAILPAPPTFPPAVSTTPAKAQPPAYLEQSPTPPEHASMQDGCSTSASTHGNGVPITSSPALPAPDQTPPSNYTSSPEAGESLNTAATDLASSSSDNHSSAGSSNRRDQAGVSMLSNCMIGSGPSATDQAPALVLVGYEPVGEDGPTQVVEYPRRPGKQVCDFYSKTGHCKFNEGCVFDHPEHFAVQLTSLGLPLRPDAPLCAFYSRHNECKYGPACKFHHPILKPIYAGSAEPALVTAIQQSRTDG